MPFDYRGVAEQLEAIAMAERAGGRMPGNEHDDAALFLTCANALRARALGDDLRVPGRGRR